MNRTFILLMVLFVAVYAYADETFEESKTYQNYLQLPSKYRNAATEKMYRQGYEAQKSVRSLPAKGGGTVGQRLDEKAKIPAVDDLGWITKPTKDGFQVERMMMLNKMQLIYRWTVDSYGKVTPINGKAMGITAGMDP